MTSINGAPPLVDMSAAEQGTAKHAPAARLNRLLTVCHGLRWTDVGVLAIDNESTKKALGDLSEILFMDVIDEVVSGKSTAAAPFLTGWKVKSLEWKSWSKRTLRAETPIGHYEITEFHATGFNTRLITPISREMIWFESVEAARDAAQADYDARTRSQIETVAPSTRAQLVTVKALPKAEAEFTTYFVKNYPGPDTLIHKPEWHAPKIFQAALHAIRSALEPSPRAQALEEAAKIAFDVSENGEYHGEASVDSTSSIYQQGAFEVYEAIRALSSQPVANGSAAARDVLAERRRQIEVEGWTPEHDDGHSRTALFRAAKCYCLHALGCAYLTAGNNKKPPVGWPWDAKWWKPKNPRRDLVRAGALLLAERDRIKRCCNPEAYLRQGGLEIDGLYPLILAEIERLDRIESTRQIGGSDADA